MADIVLQAVLSNLLIASFLAIVAWMVQRNGRLPTVANILWTLVLIKLITPPLWTVDLIPLDTIQASQETRPNDNSFPDYELNELESDFAFSGDASNPQQRPNGDLKDFDEANEHGRTTLHLENELKPEDPANKNATIPGWWSGYSFTSFLATIWLLGSAVSIVLALVRLRQFTRYLKASTCQADHEIVSIVASTSRTFQLGYVPRVIITSADVSPFCWWLGGRPEIVLSTPAVTGLDRTEQRMIIAHEVAHLKRKDHWVRWLECFVGVVLWWNPLMWCARRQLRVTEELACDALVIQKMNTSSHAYASTLLRMAELLAESAIRPPKVASAMTSGGVLERRLKMIISNQASHASRWVYGLLLVFAVAVFPLGLVYGQDIEAVEKRLAKAVAAGEISKAQAGFMLEALELSMKMKAKSERWDQEEEEDDEEREVAELKERYERIIIEIQEAVERGKLSEEQAERKAIAARKKLFGNLKNRDDDEEHEEREIEEREIAELKERYELIMAELKEAVERGKLSAGDAKRKANAIREEMFGNLKEREEDEEAVERENKVRNLIAQRKHLEALERELAQAVEDGKLSKNDASRKLSEVRKRLFQAERNRIKEDDDREDDEREEAERKERFNQIYKEIEKAVQRGELSKEDAQKKLRSVRNELYAEVERERTKRREREMDEMESRREYQNRERNVEIGREQAARKRQLEKVYAELRSAVENGRMNKEEANKKFESIRREFEGYERKSRENAKAREMAELNAKYEAMVNELEENVQAGKLSKEEAREKVNELRRKMFGDRAREDRILENKYKEYSNLRKKLEDQERALANAAREMEAAIKKGKISREDAEEKMEAFKMNLLQQRKAIEKDRERQNAAELENRKRKFAQALRLIEKAVKNGELDANEARQKADRIRKDLEGDRE